MKRYFKRILLVTIIISIFWYAKEEMYIIFKEIYTNDISTSSNNTNKLGENTNESDELLLVNDNNELEKDYIPDGLTIPNIEFTMDVNNEEKHVASIVKDPLEKMIDEARNQGIILLGNSAYRSYKSQKRVYDDRVRLQGKELANMYVAKPGYSEHQTGLCIDITNQDKYLVKGTIESDWLEENSYKFGFIIRYPQGKQNITGIEYEPWHIRYVGEAVANYIYSNGITLEEYLDE
ncbi:M15 family metallopeptidase [Clostridium sp. AL.422]|uniref:M15 family metallopeptidase n=1 Tax=Clostridium TaxID=1485 RepID=UPI00293DBA10|nr:MULTISPECIES: M15 family metallopeptidase [unclassified Clostridium]MDV4149591.1 M15 family metallopeptidase [Clostridium sp. AL.422]